MKKNLANLAPKYLKKETRAWFNSYISQYEFEEHHKKILSIAAECWDRAGEARRAIARDGLFTKDRYGTLKQHPAVKIAQDNMSLFIRAIRELGFDFEKDPEAPRPPRLY